MSSNTLCLYLKHFIGNTLKEPIIPQTDHFSQQQILSNIRFLPAHFDQAGLDPAQFVLEPLTGSVRSRLPENRRELSNLRGGGRGHPQVDLLVESRDVESRNAALPPAVLGGKPLYGVTEAPGGHPLVNKEGR